jgi:amino acid permease
VSLSTDRAFGVVLRVFSLAAIVTSFIGCFLSLTEEFSEFLREIKVPAPGEGATPRDKLPLYLSILVPPAMAAVLYPGGFLSAIESSGGYGDPFLFGLLPVCMAWQQRYQPGPIGADAPPKGEPLLPGGKFTLVAVLAVTIGMFINKSSESLPMLVAMASNHHG